MISLRTVLVGQPDEGDFLRPAENLKLWGRVVIENQKSGLNSESRGVKHSCTE
jgi:hypothetical protein